MEIGREWFKLYSAIIWDANVRRLTATQKWLYVTILCLLNEEGYDDGAGSERVRVLSVAASNPSHLSTAAGSDLRTTCIGLEKLQEYSLIIVKGDNEIAVPNWYKFQADIKNKVGGGKRKSAGHIEVDIYKGVDTDKIIRAWQENINLQQPQKIKPEDRKAVEFRLAEGAAVDEIESVLTWYNAQLGNPRTFWGGNNDGGKPIKFNIRRVMKGKLSDKLTYVYEHFLAAAKVEKPSAGPKTPEWQHKCPKAQAVRAGGHDCKKYEDWLVNPKKSSYPCNDCEEAK